MATWVVTGANRGIGLALCRHLVARGDEVIGVCRRSSDPLDALGIQVEAGVDVTDDERVGGGRHVAVLNSLGTSARVRLSYWNGLRCLPTLW